MSSSSKQKRKEHVQRQLEKQAFVKAQAALRPKTEFLCPVEFRNSIPAPAADPKLLKIQQDAGQLTAYRNTSLVQGYVGKLHAAKDVGGFFGFRLWLVVVHVRSECFRHARDEGRRCQFWRLPARWCRVEEREAPGSWRLSRHPRGPAFSLSPPPSTRRAA